MNGEIPDRHKTIGSIVYPSGSSAKVYNGEVEIWTNGVDAHGNGQLVSQDGKTISGDWIRDTPGQSKKIGDVGKLIAGAITLGLTIAADVLEGPSSGYAREGQKVSEQARLALNALDIEGNIDNLLGDYKTSEKKWREVRFRAEQKVARSKKVVIASDSAIATGDKNRKLIPVGNGTSFAVNDKGAYITNAHVVDGCRNIKLRVNGKLVDASVVNIDDRNDLALLNSKFAGDEKTYFKLTDGNLKVMEDIFVGGFPFGDVLGKNVKVTKGIISSLAGLNDDVSMFMIDAAIQPGNSGGPIFYSDGSLAGVTRATLDNAAILEISGSLPQNTNFGIKTSVLREFLIANNVSIPEQSFFSPSFSKAELVSDAVRQVVCFAYESDLPQLRETKVLFKSLMK